MSSARRPGFWRSSSYRLALVLTFVLWALTATVTCGVTDLTERTLLDEPSQLVDEELVELEEHIEAPRYYRSDFTEEELASRLVDFDPPSGASFVELVQAYVRTLRERRSHVSPVQRDDIDARLWLLGEDVPLLVSDRSPELYVALVLEETPERFHEALEATIGLRYDDWPNPGNWPSMDRQSRMALILETELDHEEAERCYQLKGGEGRVLSTNIIDVADAEFEKTPFRALSVRLDDNPSLDRQICWARAISLQDQGELLYGAIITPTFAAVQEVRGLRDLGLIVTLLASIAIGAFLGSRVFRRLRLINDVSERVAGGELGERVVVTGRGDDFDRLGANINTMLDRIEQLMSGVREVSDNIAHDLRTPLTRLRHRIEFLAQQEKPTRAEVDRLAEQADQVLETFAALLRISQLEQGSRRRSFSEFDLGSAVRDVADLYEPVFADKGIAVAAQTPEEPAVVVGDRDLWIQALSNLLDNAYKYADGGGKVDVELRREDGRPVLTVRDQGPGIPERERERVFERFYRGASDRSAPGTGLGLPLVAAVCDAHDVDIHLLNDGGLVVRMEWPHARERKRTSQS